MKHFTSLFLVLILSISVFAQTVEVEKLTTTSEMKLIMREGIGIGPSTIVVDEIEGAVLISERVTDRAIIMHIMSEKMRSEEVRFEPADVTTFFSLDNCLIGSTSVNLQILKAGKQVLFVRESNIFSGGIAFIQKKGADYVAFFINEAGAIRAADTTGKVYTSQEALSVLKALDPEKFERSRKRAKELGLEQQFLSGKALVWGDTYYNTANVLNEFWRKQLFLNRSQLFFDEQGYAYQFSFSRSGKTPEDVRDSILRCVDIEGTIIFEKEFSLYSQILSSYKQGQIFTHSVYVGFGGNIYFYVAGEEFTELFRIRRTWGKPDFYAMAVNGYTDDGYGKYVKQVLSKLSKEDLRLLRNHLFALYGYVFQSEDLSSYFDKQVWYLPVSGVTTAAITLPAERQALLDLVQAEEKKR